MDVRLELAYDKQNEVADLFEEYMNIIIDGDDEVRRCLEAQNYTHEAQDLEKKYGLPGGRLYLAYLGDEIVGCAALKKTDDVYCEIKRLYVRPGYRGKRIGKHLVEQILADARQIGYQHMRLDTFPSMLSAIQLYKNYGFYEIEQYNDNPAQTAVYMQLDLDKNK